MDFLSIEKILFVAWGYPMSYIEFFGTVAGAIAVWLSARGHVSSWPIGILNVTLFFFLFYQVQLYPDMFLQVFFFVTNLLGWWRWTHPKKSEEDQKHQLKISFMPHKWLLLFLALGFVGTLAMGNLASNLHQWFPILFSQPSAFPYADSFVTVMSIVATYLMVQKKAECWIIWILVDAVACTLYFSKGIMFVGMEYAVFCFIAAYGFWNWWQQTRMQMPAAR